jgi:hypothetical protein
MGTAFSKGQADHLPEMMRLNAAMPGESCGVMPSVQEVKAVLIDRDEALWNDQEAGVVQFSVPMDGQLLRISVGPVSVYVDHTGKTTLVDGGIRMEPGDVESLVQRVAA